MQIHALEFDDFCIEDYSLIGIHTTLEDYKLAYLLNKNLDTRFYKSKENLVFQKEKNKVSFSLYNYENKFYDFNWFLIANSFTEEKLSITNQLLLSTETKSYLIPEKKKVDFFIKISGEVDNSFIVKTIEKINKIESVITAYTINKNTLKSKDFLIF